MEILTMAVNIIKRQVLVACQNVDILLLVELSPIMLTLKINLKMLQNVSATGYKPSAKQMVAATTQHA